MLGPFLLEATMRAENFDQLVLDENAESTLMLCRKAEEYAGDHDRLENFKQAAGMLSVNPAEALMGMLVKHFVSVGKMSKSPNAYTMDKWDEKLRDIRNYTYLLKAVLIDLGVHI
jgi:hypothetical protein